MSITIHAYGEEREPVVSSARVRVVVEEEPDVDEQSRAGTRTFRSTGSDVGSIEFLRAGGGYRIIRKRLVS